MKHPYSLYQTLGNASKVLQRARDGTLRNLAEWNKPPQLYKIEHYEGGAHLGPGWYVRTYNPDGALIPGQWVNLALLQHLTGATTPKKRED